MDVVIFCGGNGTRLSEDTVTKPKPMIEIDGVPILVHIMRLYSNYGFKRFILALGYKSECIKQYFYNYKVSSGDIRIKLDPKSPVNYLNHSEEKDWEISLINTGQNVAKSDRLRKIKKFILSDTFHLTYGDGIGNINLKKLVEFHNSHNKIGTVTAVHPPSRFGQLMIDGDDVKSFEEKGQMTEEYINGGFFVFDKRIFNYLRPNDPNDFEFGPLKTITQGGQLKAFKHNHFWQCMDTARQRDYLNELAITNELSPWEDYKD